MPSEDLKFASKDDLIAELINRETFVGMVIFCRGDAKGGRLEPGEIVMTKSPPLPREGVETLLEIGQSLVPGMFAAPPDTDGCGPTPEFPLTSQNVLLRTYPGGVVRVGGTRISFDLIVEQYESGMTPEDMVRAYDSLSLADVYAAIGHYLNHRDAVQQYLKRRDAECEVMRAQLEAEGRTAAARALKARRSREAVDAPTGH